MRGCRHQKFRGHLSNQIKTSQKKPKKRAVQGTENLQNFEQSEGFFLAVNAIFLGSFAYNETVLSQHYHLSCLTRLTRSFFIRPMRIFPLMKS